LLLSIAHPIFEFYPGFATGKKMLDFVKLFQGVSMAENSPVVLMSTSKGNIRIELDALKAPITTQNFIDYVSAGHYDGLIFHRVIPGFMIQGGGMDAQMNEKKNKAPIKNEAANGLKNDLGTLAMARTNVVDSATAQFFINVKNNDFLNHRSPAPAEFGYAVFGKVIEGMDVVQSIEKVRTGNKGHHQDVPVEAVVIHSAKVEA